MKVILPIKICLLACSVLAGAPAFADPVFTTQSFTSVNSIEFSFMDYGNGPSGGEGTPDGKPTSEFPTDETPPPLPPTGGIGDVPPKDTPTGSLPVGGAPQQDDDPVPTADVPEPASLALIGLGLMGIALRRRA